VKPLRHPKAEKCLLFPGSKPGAQRLKPLVLLQLYGSCSRPSGYFQDTSPDAIHVAQLRDPLRGPTCGSLIKHVKVFDHLSRTVTRCFWPVASNDAQE
jgi:hypothetical protein